MDKQTGESGMAQNEKPPEGPEALGGSDLAGGDDSEKFSGRLERYGSGRHRGLQMLSHLREHEHHEQKAIARLRDCGDYLAFHDYYTVGKIRLVGANFCMQHLLCPLCAMRRGAKYVDGYLKRLTVIRQQNPTLRLYMATFTVKNGEDLEERFQHLRQSIKTLHDRRRDYLKKGRGRTSLAHVEGAVWSFEVTNKGNGWHPHVHAIYLAPSAPSQAALRDEWERITGDSFMVDVRPISDQEADGFVEVFKYALKFSDLALADNVEAWRTFKGRRLVASFGLFRGVKVPEALTDERLEGLPYIERFYRYLPAGYSLQSCKHHTPEDDQTPQAADE